LAYSSTLKTVAIHYSRTSIDFYRTTRRHFPEVRTHHNHSCENLNSQAGHILVHSSVKTIVYGVTLSFALIWFAAQQIHPKIGTSVSMKEWYTGALQQVCKSHCAGSPVKNSHFAVRVFLHTVFYILSFVCVLQFYMEQNNKSTITFIELYRARPVLSDIIYHTKNEYKLC
jgi:hypothetical protein